MQRSLPLGEVGGAPEAVFPDSSFAIGSAVKAGYSSTQLSTLETIAAACPQEYGPGVYVARAMLSAQDTVIYTAINDCEKAPVTPSGRFAAPEQDDEDKTDVFNLYPNPNSGEFTVVIGAEETSEVEMIVWNIAGQKVSRKRLSVGVNMLNLGVANGLYLYRVAINGETRWTGKVSVVQE